MLHLDDGRDIPFATVPSASSLVPFSEGDYDTEIKALMIGDANVGKTFLKIRFAGQPLPAIYRAETDVQLLTKLFKFNSAGQEKRVRLDLWDTPGDEEYSDSIGDAYFKAATVIIIVFSLTSTGSFSHVQQYLETAKKQATEGAKVVLVGTKSDRVADIQVKEAKIKAFIKGSTHRIDAYIETSAERNININYLFQMAATIALDLPLEISPVASAPAPSAAASGRVCSFMRQLFCCGGGRKIRSGAADGARGVEEDEDEAEAEAARRENQPLLG